MSLLSSICDLSLKTTNSRIMKFFSFFHFSYFFEILFSTQQKAFNVFCKIWFAFK